MSKPCMGRSLIRVLLGVHIRVPYSVGDKGTQFGELAVDVPKTYISEIAPQGLQDPNLRYPEHETLNRLD